MSAERGVAFDAPHGDDERPAHRANLLVTVAVLTTLVAALLPVLPMVQSGTWVPLSIALPVLLLASGYLARRRGLPAVAVSLIEAIVWLAFMTGAFLSSTALLWVIPTIETLRALPEVVSQAMNEITVGVAPLDSTLALSFLIVGALGLLTIIVDHVVLTARMPLLASVGVIAVSLIPSIAGPYDVDIMAFVLLVASVFFLLRADTRGRERKTVRVAERAAGVPATAFGIAAIALVVTLVATPILPNPSAPQGTGIGGGPGIDASLQLGDDLRRPQEVEVLRVSGTTDGAPYLRATTLSRFDGAVWLPDRVRTVTLESDFGLGALGVADDIRMVESTTNVEVVNLSSVWAPIPFPAVEVTGLEGEWSAVPYNRTVVAEAGSTQGQVYDVVASVPEPTVEQMRARQADIDNVFDEAKELPDDLPPVIAERALEITAGAETDYDALVALQRWFRGSDFRYSLDAPVEDGFDGTGADAVAEFLEVREGYCIHFASAFALMARSLGMPTRIVVGYLPGVSTPDRVDDRVVYSVASSLLHAWPEVYFEGVGWIGFEPTNSLGTPTTFRTAASTPDQPADSEETAPRPTSSASTDPSAAPDDRLDPRDEAATGSDVSSGNPWPALIAVLGILALLAIPGVVREVRRRRLLAAAHAGDAAAAWLTVQDAAIDVGVPVPSSESPRAFAARLALEYGAPAGAVDTLVAAIERASYAPAAAAEEGSREMTNAALAVRAALLRTAPPARRALALLVPRSLIVRPGSVYATGSDPRMQRT